MILGGSKQGYRWLNLGIQMAQNQNIIHPLAVRIKKIGTDVFGQGNLAGINTS
jgi:hypothetical protein